MIGSFLTDRQTDRLPDFSAVNLLEDSCKSLIILRWSGIFMSFVFHGARGFTENLVQLLKKKTGYTLEPSQHCGSAFC